MSKPKAGRTTTELVSYPWPMITRNMLAEKPDDSWSAEKKALVEGFQALKEAELRLGKLARSESKGLARRAVELLGELKELQRRWPLSVV